MKMNPSQRSTEGCHAMQPVQDEAAVALPAKLLSMMVDSTGQPRM